MLKPSRSLLGFVVAATFAVVGTSAWADDSEIFVAESTAAPNIMLILDTSGSMMGQLTTQEPYDPSRDYVAEASGSCASIADRVFYKTNNQGTPPSCNSSDWFSHSNLRCAAAKSALDAAGMYQGDRFIQWRRSSSSTRQWRTLNNSYDTPVECRADNGFDGDLSSENPYPNGGASSNNDTPVWTNRSNDSFWRNNANGGTSATLYSANYVAYWNQFRTQRLGTRLSVMQEAARTLLNSVSNVNVGLMRYSRNDGSSESGGMVLWPISPIETSRQTLINLIDNFIPGGYTPLAETLYEAHQYFSGGTVHFGNTTRACTVATSGICSTSNTTLLPSVASSRVGGTADGTHYESPITDSCQKNFIVYLTDGEPTNDNDANTQIAALAGGSCGQEGCLAALTEYMFTSDLRASVAGEQNVTTYFIGFGSDFSDTSNEAFELLRNAARRGGGEAYQAGDLTELTQVFTNIFGSILGNSTTLTAPTIAVNAFNRTQTLSDLYVSVFQPASAMHWPGNVKKYRVNPEGQIVDRNDNPAIDPTTGFFRDSSSDVWSETTADGPSVSRGGAANQIPDPSTRRLYTYLENNPNSPALLTAAQRAFVESNTAITDELLGTDPTEDLTREKLIAWARGADVDDEDQDGDTSDPRLVIGDPMHSQPAVVIYGGTTSSPDIDDAVIFSATNDGYLHAIDARTGEELWAFIPQELIGRLKLLYENQNTVPRSYGLDGDIRVLQYDVNGDGIITPSENDRVLIFFSTGRNASVSRYYALDVTNKNAPRFLWSIGDDVLPGLGQAWSAPEIARVNIAGATQNSQKLVLIFGGGYDPIEESGPFNEENAVGNRIYIVDALYGTLLWWASNDSDANLVLDRMTHSIPASITVLDLDGNGFADRMYAGDMAAQLWRFDIYNGNNADELVAGGVFASLGSYEDASHPAESTRRFYYAPDAAVLSLNNGPVFLNLAIGSGYRGRPLSTSTQDRFYSIRDHRPFVRMTQEQYNSWTPIRDADLIDITTDLAPTIPPSANGWKLRLDQPNNVWRGEKVLAAANTFQNTIFFTTYTPSPSAVSNACTLAVGSNRAYAVSAFDGRPILPRRDTPTDPEDPENPSTPTPSPEDRYDELYQGGIAPEVTFLFPERNRVVCLSGVEVLNACRNFNSRVKTFWRESTAE